MLVISHIQCILVHYAHGLLSVLHFFKPWSMQHIIVGKKIWLCKVIHIIHGLVTLSFTKRKMGDGVQTKLVFLVQIVHFSSCVIQKKKDIVSKFDVVFSWTNVV